MTLTFIPLDEPRTIYAPPLSPELKSALASLNDANARAQRIGSCQFTTTSQAGLLPGLLVEVINQAKAALEACE